MHFAAESHVDRSIRGPEEFIQTNINGTFALLEEARTHWAELSGDEHNQFRFLQRSYGRSAAKRAYAKADRGGARLSWLSRRLSGLA